jgi:hypothetical protein
VLLCPGLVLVLVPMMAAMLIVIMIMMVVEARTVLGGSAMA